MHSTVNMYPSVTEAPAIAPRQSESIANLTWTKSLLGMWSSLRCGAELIAGVFIAFYLLAALALTGAVLFYTFNR
ncbi:MAG: hypothetical protein WAM44_08695 [Chthoniobacterales bacterium]